MNSIGFKWELNWKLLKQTDYSKSRNIKRIIWNMDQLWNMAVMGDAVALSIYLDINQAINAEGILTKGQRDFLCLWRDGFKQIEIAAKYRISQQQVSVRIGRAIRNISKGLRKGGIYMGKVYIVSDKPVGETITDIGVSTKIRCAGCCNEFSRGDLLAVKSRYDGADVYLCSKCHRKYAISMARFFYNTQRYPDIYIKGGHEFGNINSTGEVYRGEYCPKCYLYLTTEGKCPSCTH